MTDPQWSKEAADRAEQRGVEGDIRHTRFIPETSTGERVWWNHDHHMFADKDRNPVIDVVYRSAP